MSSNSETERALESEIAELPTVAEVIAAMGARRRRVRRMWRNNTIWKWRRIAGAQMSQPECGWQT